jgi:hypothetical protein
MACATASHKPAGCVPGWGDIVPGTTSDHDLVALYGEGTFIEGLDGVFARLYRDAGVTLAVIVNVRAGGLVESVTLEPKFPPSEIIPTVHIAADSAHVHPEVGFGVQDALHLGSTRDEVRANLGEPPPVQGLRADAWLYRAEDLYARCGMMGEVMITFGRDRVNGVAFSAPPTQSGGNPR